MVNRSGRSGNVRFGSKTVTRSTPAPTPPIVPANPSGTTPRDAFDLTLLNIGGNPLPLAAPGTITSSAVHTTGNALQDGDSYYVKVAAVDAGGNQGPATLAGPITMGGGSNTYRAAFAQVTNATNYRIYCSTDFNPLFIGEITETQRAAGVIFTGSNGGTTGGSTPGAVDIPFDGTGPTAVPTSNDATINLRVVKDEHGQPQFQEGSAPALVDTIATDTLHGYQQDNISFGTQPPEQGKTNLNINFAHGLNQDPIGNYHQGFYNWGESVWTIDTGGLALRAPAMLPVLLNTLYITSYTADTFPVITTSVPHRLSVGNIVTIAHCADSGMNGQRTVASVPSTTTFTTSEATASISGTDGEVRLQPLDARVESACTHNASSWFSAGNKVYFIDEVDGRLVIKEPLTQPSGTFRITRIFSWQGILLVAHDTVDPYEWSLDDGATWHLAGIDGPPISIAAPGLLTTSIVTGGSLTDTFLYYVIVTAQNAAGQESAPTIGTARVAATPDLTVRIAFGQVANAVSYNIYLSTDADPKLVGNITEANRATGIVIDTPGHTTAGGVAGAVDVQCNGVGDQAPAAGRLSTGIVTGGSLTDMLTYTVKVSAVDSHGIESVATEGAPQTMATPDLTLRVAVPAVTDAVLYRVYCSTDLNPRFVATITPAELATGIVIDSNVPPYTTAGGGGPGFVDIQVAGQAAFTSPGTITTSLQPGGSLVTGATYQVQVQAFSPDGAGSAAVAGTTIATVGSSKTIRLAFDKVAASGDLPAAASYAIFLSTVPAPGNPNATAPLFVGYVTEVHRAAGRVLVKQGGDSPNVENGTVALPTLPIASPGVLTTSRVNGGSLVNTSVYNIRVTAIDVNGVESYPTLGAAVTAATPNLTARIAFAQVTGAVTYKIYLSTATTPLFVGHITEAQRASGIKITAQDTTGAGGTAGAVDVEVAGTGYASPLAGGFVDVQLAGTGVQPIVTNVAQATDVQRYGKFFADYQDSAAALNPSRPIILMSNDPNQVFQSENPTDAAQWSAGSLVGQGGSFNPDHNTSLSVAPTGELLVGKAVNLFQLLNASDASASASAATSGNVEKRMGPVAQSTDVGMENFAWPAAIQFSFFGVIHDYDIMQLKPQRLSSNFGGVLLTPTIGFGPAFKLPAIPQAQKAVVAIATDHSRLLFAALSGDEGYILAGLDPGGQDDTAFEWHGSIARTGWPIRFLWTESFPLSGDKRDLYLFAASNESPYDVAAMRLPRTNVGYDPDTVFVQSASIDLGPDYGGQAQVPKVLSRATPNTMRLDSNPYGPNCVLDYRVAPPTPTNTNFVELGTFTHSPLPLPADVSNSYLPVGVYGTFVEVKATLQSPGPNIVSTSDAAATVVTTDVDHGFVFDQHVFISGCLDTKLNGDWIISAVDSPTTFRLQDGYGHNVSSTGSAASPGVSDGIVTTLESIETAAALESVEAVQFRRPIRKDLISCTVYADTSGMTREGGRRGASWEQLRRAIKACRDAIQPPMLVENSTNLRWTVDIQDFKRRWVDYNDGNGATMVVDLVMQELDTSLAVATAGVGAPFHVHLLEQFTGPLASITLEYVPIIQPEVFVNRALLLPTVDYIWNEGSRIITFTIVQSGIIRVYYEKAPSS